MRKFAILSILASAIMLLLPLNALNESGVVSAAVGEKGQEYVKPDENTESFRVKIGENITEIKTEDYIFGVLAAEMPALYHEEALKAQAVAAYTYALSKRQANKENDFDITADYNIDQSFISPDEANAKWGENAALYTEKLKNCIKEVKGYVITYKNSPITAVYHAISSGKTENCKDIWGRELEYLTSVSSVGDKLSPDYSTSVALKKEEFLEKLNITEKDKIFGKCERTEAGTVKAMEICEKSFSGEKIRELLALRSANFEAEIKDGEIVFTVYGYGHGVGMSQYGANIMAKEGADFKEILNHYYKAVKIEKLK